MKVAVLVYGAYREFDIAVKSWRFLNEFDCDVYMSTSNVSKLVDMKKISDSFSFENIKIVKSDDNYFEKDVNIVEMDVTEEMITKYIPNAKITITNESDIEFDFKRKDYWVHNSNKMIFHWKKCLSMLLESNIKYDSIILTRADNYYSEYYDFKEFNGLKKENTIYGLNYIHITGHDNYFLVDRFFYGNYKEMVKFIDSLPNQYDFNEQIHSILPKYILSLNYYVERIDNGFNTEVVRPNVRLLDENKINIDTIRECLWKWGKS